MEKEIIMLFYNLNFMDQGLKINFMSLNLTEEERKTEERSRGRRWVSDFQWKMSQTVGVMKKGRKCIKKWCYLNLE